MSKSPMATTLPLAEIEPTPQAEVALETPQPLADVEVKPAPTLITEQQVMFSTAAAVGAPSTWWWPRASRALTLSMRRVFATTAADPRPKRQHYPPHCDFIADARMEREMHRL